ncbi:MAG: hypothetical protein DRI54_01725 [Bacteroidetes bacterium]|nr:MAG: hypothetical protein DRI54_01725 [Bacteroidota bacterium]
MPLDKVQLFYDTLAKDHLSFLFQGAYNDDMTGGILELTEYNIDNYEGLTKLKKKISFLIVECFQNIVRHGQVEEKYDIPEGVFITRNRGNINYISSINYLKTELVDSLRDTLNKLKNFSKEELKEFYLKTLIEIPMSGKGGAGLGLIELARKSSLPLSFDFKKVDDNLSIFYFLVRMENELEGKADDQLEALDLDSFIEFYDMIKRTNTMMVYKGDFAKASILPILKIFEDSMQNLDGNINIKKRVYIIMVELLENISEHAVEYSVDNQDLKEGIFILGIKDNMYMISTGNKIENEQVPKIKAYIESLKDLSYAELRRLYVKNLKKSKLIDSEYDGLGLIDIVSESGDNINFNFKKLNDKHTFFSIDVQI